MHQKFFTHTALFKKFPSLTLEAKIKVYTLKVLNNLENAKCLCQKENTNNNEREKFEDELELQTIDLDYDTIHTEILDNILFDENDSGLSDFDANGGECDNPKKKVFEINKIKKIIHSSVQSLFTECQNDEQFKPLIVQEKQINKENIQDKNKTIENNNIDLSNNNENKTKENTVDYIEIKNENDNQNENNSFNENEKEKGKKIICYKKYDIFTDPNSNYNNFTKKFIVENNSKKRFRDIHPFLKDFNPKFLKKENIDKKIFRKFRKYFKNLYKENKNSPIFSKNVFFWKKFYTQNLLPPVKIENNGEIIEHKSFNTQYLIWLFNQEGITELFKLFLKKESENVVNNFITEYNLNESNEPNIIEKLKKYMDYIPEIYGAANNEDKNIELEENKEEFNVDTNEISRVKQQQYNYDNNNLEWVDSENNNSNPFDLNFDLMGKKNFKESPYEINDFYLDEEKSVNNHYFKKWNDNKSEIFEYDDSLTKQLSNNIYK